MWSFEPGSPQFPYQVPPAAQQLREPDIMLIPHLGHTGPAAVVMGDIVSAAVVTGDVVSAAVVMGDVVSAVVVMGDVVSAVVVLGLQAWMPSDQEWSKFELPGAPHFPYQVPLTAQQLRKPDFLMTPHLGHTALTAVVMGGVVAAVVDVWAENKIIERQTLRKSSLELHTHTHTHTHTYFNIESPVSLSAVVMGVVVAAVVDVGAVNKIIEKALQVLYTVQIIIGITHTHTHTSFHIVSPVRLSLQARMPSNQE